MRNRIQWNFGALALVAGLGLGAATPASAQEPAPRQGTRMEQHRPDSQRIIGRRVALLTERLNLTEDQAARVRELFGKEAEQRKAILKKAGLEPGRAHRSRDSLPRTELRQLREQTEQELLALLDEQQKKEYERLKEELQSRGPRGGERRDGKWGSGAGVRDAGGDPDPQG